MKKRRILALLLSTALLLTQTVTVSAQSPDEAQADEAAVSSALPYGLKGMPAGYRSTADEKELKSEALASVSSLEKLTPGVDYAAGQIVYLAGSEEDARTIAEAYNAELVKFQYGVASANLKGGLTVPQAVAVGADASYNMPAVSANFITRMEQPMISDDPEPEAPESDEIATTWEEWWLQLNDPALTPGYMFKAKSAEFPDNEGRDARGYQWMHDAIGTYEAWATTMGSSDITVAVIDSGVDDQHEDLKGHSVNLTDVVDLSYTEAKVDENGNYVLDENGNYIYETIIPDAADDVGHGTHVAGIIAATANNGVGGAGVAPGVNIIGLPVFICDDNGNTGSFDSAIISALMYSAGYNKDGSKGERRADIVNMSIGGYGYNIAYQQALTKAYESGVTVCAAMGNEISNCVEFPAKYDHVIAVSATDRDNKRAGFSNYGPWADIAAPGVGIFSTWNGHDYGSDGQIIDVDHNDWYICMDGTSMATPVVSGACALYMSAVGHVDPDTMEYVLKSTATKLSDKTIGAGLVNVAAMMPDTAKNAEAQIFAVSAETGEETKVTSSVTLEDYDSIIFRCPEGVAAKYVIYTVDGSEPTIKNGKLDKNTYVCETDVNTYPHWNTYAENATLKAALIGMKGFVGKTVSVSLKLSAIEDFLRINGSETISVGKSVTFTAYRYSSNIPKGAKILWSLENAPAGVTVSNSGKVSVKKTVPVGTKFTVVAAASDNSALRDSLEVEVIELVTFMSLGFEEGSINEKVNAPVKDKNGNYKSIRLFTTDIPTTEFDETRVTPVVSSNVAAHCNITVANPSIAYYDGNDIVGISPGKTKVTFAMTDGSGKKLTLDVNVVVPASDLNLRTKTDQIYLGFGKSAQVDVMLGDTYGTPTITAVDWYYTARADYYDDYGNPVVNDITDLYHKNKLVTISKTGKVSLSAKAEAVESSIKEMTLNGTTYYLYNVIIYIHAVTTDGTYLSAEKFFYTTTPVSKLVNVSEPGDYGWVTVKGNKFIFTPASTDENGYFSETLYATLFVGAEDALYFYNDLMYTISSSNPDCAGAVYQEVINADYNMVAFTLFVSKPGKAKITITANDGSNKKITFEVEAKSSN